MCFFVVCVLFGEGMQMRDGGLGFGAYEGLGGRRAWRRGETSLLLVFFRRGAGRPTSTRTRAHRKISGFILSFWKRRAGKGDGLSRLAPWPLPSA